MTEKTEKLKNREKKISKTGAASKTRAVVDVEADQGGGGEHGRLHVLRYVIDFRSPMLCIKIGHRVYNVLR